MKRKISSVESGRPTICGAGLIALDIIVPEGGEAHFFAGGTCGNVMAIMSHLGWAAKPLARIGMDRAAKVVMSDLSFWGVDLSSISIRPLTKTPIIIEKLRKDANGLPFHTFSFFCPNCNKRFAGYQPVPLKSLSSVVGLPPMEVLFLDRASPGGLALARRATDLGAVVVFEPPRVSEDKNFLAILKLATIVKYSHDRIDQLDLETDSSTLLEVQTLGRGGARFRTKLADFGEGWHHMHADQVVNVVDSAGCGDWFTAGLISSLCSKGVHSLTDADNADILGALSVAQALAAWNCGFVGARGGMYTPALREIKAIYKTQSASIRLRSKSTQPDLGDLRISKLCGDCQEVPQRVNLTGGRRRA